MSLAFDTLKATKALQQAGFPQSQAEAVAVTVGEAMVGNVATKADLKQAETNLRAELRQEIGGLRAELKGEIGAVRAELKEDVGSVREEIGAVKIEMADRFRDLYKHLWVMGFGIVILNVTLTVGILTLLIPAMLPPG